MKKIVLLLSLATLFYYSGIAQKNETGTARASHVKKSTEKDFSYKAHPSKGSVTQQNPKQIESFTYESFEGTFPPAGWTKQDPDAGTGWGQQFNGTSPVPGFQGGTQTVPPGGGSKVAYCTYLTGGTSSNNQWLITPQFNVTSGDSLKFYMWWFGSYADTVYIKLSTTTNAVASFTTTLMMLDTSTLSPMSTWKRFAISLTPYAGQNIYIGFQEKISDNVNNGAYIALDLVYMGTPPANDASTISIDEPFILAPNTVSPLATVMNMGSQTQTFDVTMTITGGYTSTKTVTGLASFAIQQVTFDPWTPALGFDTVRVYTQLAGDANTGNDTLSMIIHVYEDVQSLSIDVPPVVGVGTQTPKATFKCIGGDASNFNVTMTISGGYTSTKNITFLKTDSVKQVSFDPWTASLGTDTVTVYTQLTGDLVTNNDTLTKIVNVQSLKKAYCYVAYDPKGTIAAGPAYTYLQAPNQLISIANQSTLGFVNGTWGGNNKWYGAVYGTNTLVTLDTNTGARTTIGTIGLSVQGLAYDYTTNKLFGVSWNGSASSLYSISTANGTPTLVGQSTTDLLINLACDLNGNLFSVGITKDTLYSLNKTTGLATPVGYIGFNAGYAQGMTFDLSNDSLYMAAYNIYSTSHAGGEMRKVNTLTGATSLIGLFADSTEVTGLAIPYNATLPALDASVTSKSSPVSACGLGSDSIKVVVQNLGTTSINNVPVHYSINGGTPVDETISATIPAGGFVTYTFTTQANLAANGFYTIKVYTTLAGDAIIANDTLTFTIENVTEGVPPYSMGFEPIEDFNGWTIDDVNGDGDTWQIAGTGGNTGPHCAEYVYSSATSANDWIVTKCLQLDASKLYRLIYWYKSASSSYPESMETFIGTSPAYTSLTTLINNLPSITATSYTKSQTNFTVSTSGVYYIGFKCYSAANEYVLYLDDINIADVTGITENNNANDISIYPNPANENLTIENNSINNSVCSVLDLQGQQIFSQPMLQGITEINISALAPGMYFIKVNSDKGIVMKKFIKE